MAQAGLLKARSSERQGQRGLGTCQGCTCSPGHREADTRAGAQLPGFLTGPGDSSWRISSVVGISPLGRLKELGQSAGERRKGSPRVVVGLGTEQGTLQFGGPGRTLQLSFPMAAIMKSTDLTT